MKRTAIYLRVSTDRQAKEGDSIPAQREALRKYIDEYEDLVFVGEYIDDGISGTKLDRDEYQRMLSDVQAGKIDLVCCTKLDRLHRGLRNFLNMQDIMEKSHCNWIAIWEPMYDSSTPQGKMIINTMVNLAQFEAENTGQRIRQVFEYKRSKGEYVSGIAPIGYDIVQKKLVPNSDAALVRSAFELFARNGKLFEVGRLLSNHGYTRHDKSVKHLLKNPIYKGVYHGQPGIITPIVECDLWDDVQRKMTINIKRSQTATYVFSGLVICADCGHRMTGYLEGNASGKRHARYRCRMFYNAIKRQCCNGKGISDNVLEKFLINNLPSMIEEEKKAFRQDSEKQEDHSKQITALNRKIERLKDLYIMEEISMDEYKSDKAKYLSELEALESLPQKPLKDYDKIITIYRDSLNGYWSKLQEERRVFWRQIIREIRIDHDRNITVEFL